MLRKMANVQGDSQRLGAFLKWYREQPADIENRPIEQVLARYFGIDLDQVELERRKVLAYQRVINAFREIHEELGLEVEK